MYKYKYILLLLFTCLFLITNPMDIYSEEESSDRKPISRQQIISTQADTLIEPVYPLYREHSLQYYPTRSSRKAKLLSATMPGLGQAYADNYIKATLFLATEITIFSYAGYHFARAIHYRNHNTFGTGFYDERSGNFLTKDQVSSRSADHNIRGVLFLITGIGVHVWNILDASKSVDAYNNRRISVQMQHNKYGRHTFIFTHSF